mmetsp:Transcript_45503/g.114511  ORF Transcript_45503/g.114511 Transcript_45503/m.114511 type:complete len:338 (-) Transcript_45503:1511-2524(-)
MLYACVRVHVRVCLCAHMYVCVCVDICMCVFLCTYTCVYVVRVCLCVCPARFSRRHFPLQDCFNVIRLQQDLHFRQALNRQGREILFHQIAEFAFLLLLRHVPHSVLEELHCQGAQAAIPQNDKCEQGQRLREVAVVVLLAYGGQALHVDAVVHQRVQLFAEHKAAPNVIHKLKTANLAVMGVAPAHGQAGDQGGEEVPQEYRVAILGVGGKECGPRGQDHLLGLLVLQREGHRLCHHERLANERWQDAGRVDNDGLHARRRREINHKFAVVALCPFALGPNRQVSGAALGAHADGSHGGVLGNRLEETNAVGQIQVVQQRLKGINLVLLGYVTLVQ